MTLRTSDDALRGLTRVGLRALADALESGRLRPPFSPLALQQIAPTAIRASLAEGLQELVSDGLEARHLARFLRLLADERKDSESGRDALELVWTGPDASAPGRDTSVVVRDLFQHARNEILVSTYAIQNGKTVFAPLAVRMDADPALAVTLVVDIHRKEHKSVEAHIQGFVHVFRTYDWPGKRFPTVYFDPRSLEDDPEARASLHAKCLVVDREVAFVTSANFTDAAQNRNVEAGVLIQDDAFARHLHGAFDTLIAEGLLRRIDVG